MTAAASSLLSGETMPASSAPSSSIESAASARGYDARITSYVVIVCATAAMAGVLFGYDIGISGGVTSMEPFLKKFFPEVLQKMEEETRSSGGNNYCKFDSQLLTSFTSSLYLAGLVSTLFASTVTTSLGRRTSMLIGAAAFLAGAAVGGAALDIYALILGRILLGIGVGFACQSVAVYVAEMSPPRLRGAFNNGIQLCVCAGQLTANLINYGTEKIAGGWGWRISLSLAAVPAAILAAGALFLPDTPNSLVLRGDTAAALAVLRKIRGTPDVDDELRDLIAAATKPSGDESRRSFALIRKLLRRRYRPQLVMSFAIPFFTQVTGINVIAFYAPLIFRTMGLREGASLASAVATGLVGAISTSASMLAVDRVGRRALFLAGGATMLVSQAVVGAVLAAELGDSGGIGGGAAAVVLVSICVYVAGFGWSWGPLGWLVPTEIYPLELRPALQSVTVAVSFAFTFAVAQGFLAVLCRLKAAIFFLFAGCIAVMTIFVFLLLPETKGRPIEMVDEVWKDHWFWGKIVQEEEELPLA